MMEVSVAEAAKILGVSRRRVRALAASGELSSRRLGRSWIVELDEGAPPRPAGRRLSARSAWGVLGLGEDRLSRSERQRARERRQRFGALQPEALVRRADVHRLVAHPAALARLADDERLVLSGVSAAGHHGADILAVDQVEAYVPLEALDHVRRGHALRRPAAGDRANVILRVPHPSWPFDPGQRHAPPLVVAADLLDARDERSVRAAQALIA